ncbi:MAG: hypothetical protein ABIX28_07295 [Vicinamibacterales bacterium]
MDFIERWFGINPDGGSGSLEAIYLIVIALAAVALASRLFRRSAGG